MNDDDPIKELAIESETLLLENGRRGPSSQDLLAVLESRGASFAEALFGRSINLSQVVDRTRSREVSTHYKWCLFDSPAVSIWLNEYKSPSAVGYARSIHNHRYDFASMVLRGGLDQRTYDVNQDAENIAAIAVRSRQFIGKGQSYALAADEVHEVIDWTPGTVSLLLKAPAVRSFSTVFDLSSFSAKRITSMSGLEPLASSAKPLDRG